MNLNNQIAQFPRAILILAALLLVVSGGALAQTMIEYSSGITGAGGPSSGARPTSIIAGQDGNVWFLETTANRIGKIAPSGLITEYSAGISAYPGFSGIAAGADGNIWFTEYYGNRIGKITPSGVVTEISAGITPNAGLSTITDGPDGNLWFIETNANQIGRITPAGVVTEFSAGISAQARLSSLTWGPDNNLWFTEMNHGRIGKITVSGVVTEYSIAMPSDNASLESIATGPDGNLWVTVWGRAIGKVTPAGVVTWYTAGISDTRYSQIVYGLDGNMWFTEYIGNRIGKISPSGAVTEYANIMSPLGLAAGWDGNMWYTVPDRIGKITPDGVVTEYVKGIEPVVFPSPAGIASGPDGNLWFTEAGSTDIGRISPEGVVTEFVAGTSGLTDLALAPNGNIWAVGSHSIVMMTPSGVPTKFNIVPQCGCEEITLSGFAVAPDGNAWFTYKNRIGRLAPSGTITYIDAGALWANQITFGPDGTLWFAEYEGNRIGRMTPAGVVTVFDTGIRIHATDLAVGADGSVWLTDFLSKSIGRLSPSGTFTLFGAGLSSTPSRIAGARDGNMWFTEATGNKIGRITPSGVITEFGAGITAQAKPLGITAGPDGNIWFTENAGNRIGKFTAPFDSAERMTGLWWNPNEPGWGMTVEQQGQIMFVSWFTYGQGGNSTRYFMSNCAVTSTGCSGKIYSISGGAAPTTPWNGHGPVIEVGSGTLTFSDANTSVFNFVLNGVAGSKNIQRMAFAPQIPLPPIDFSGLWWNPNESGWGLFFEHQASIIFAAFFAFDSVGNPVRYVASNCAVIGSVAAGYSCTGALYKTSGGSAPTVPWSESVTQTPVGNLTVTFGDSSNATISFTIDGQKGSKTISKMAF